MVFVNDEARLPHLICPVSVKIAFGMSPWQATCLVEKEVRYDESFPAALYNHEE
jgi:hypothetical protein